MYHITTSIFIPTQSLHVMGKIFFFMMDVSVKAEETRVHGRCKVTLTEGRWKLEREHQEKIQNTGIGL